MSFISTTLLSVIAILLASTAYTLFAPALMQKSDKIPVPAPTSNKKYICRCYIDTNQAIFQAKSYGPKIFLDRKYFCIKKLVDKIKILHPKKFVKKIYI